MRLISDLVPHEISGRIIIFIGPKTDKQRASSVGEIYFFPERIWYGLGLVGITHEDDYDETILAKLVLTLLESLTYNVSRIHRPRNDIPFPLRKDIQEEQELKIEPRSHLRTAITSSFNDDEFQALIFDLNLDFEYISEQTLNKNVIRFIEFCDRRNLLSKIIEKLKERRPDHIWLENY